MVPRSPCSKPECLLKVKTECLQDCEELSRYQHYLMVTEDRISPPGIDYTEEERTSIRYHFGGPYGENEPLDAPEFSEDDFMKEV
jgi:hypothetical protein